jgi:hypothetical protein
LAHRGITRALFPYTSVSRFVRPTVARADQIAPIVVIGRGGLRALPPRTIRIVAGHTRAGARAMRPRLIRVRFRRSSLRGNGRRRRPSALTIHSAIRHTMCRERRHRLSSSRAQFALCCHSRVNSGGGMRFWYAIKPSVSNNSDQSPTSADTRRAARHACPVGQQHPQRYSCNGSRIRVLGAVRRFYRYGKCHDTIGRVAGLLLQYGGNG